MDRLKRVVLRPVGALETLLRSGATTTSRGIRPLLLAVLACLGGSVLALGGGGVSPVYASAAGNATCSGGSLANPSTVAPGTYNTLTITGICGVDAGAVTANNVVVTNGGWLVTAFGAATGNPTVFTAKNVSAGPGTVVILGCEPEFPCLNDPDQANPTYTGTFDITGNLTTTGANSVIAHNGSFGGNVAIQGGGGGTTCNFATGPLNGGPYYDDVEDSTIGGNLIITGVSTCWLGTFRLQVSGNMIFNGNTDPNATQFNNPTVPDGNEVATNQIGHNLICQGNDPTPQFGDSGGSPNTVSGRAIGQCTAVAG